MNILFLHRNFPGQFKNILVELAKDSKNKIFFITCNDTAQLKGVNKIVYRLDKQPPKELTEHLTFYAAALAHANAAAEVASELKKNGFVPDVIYGHSWGPEMFMKDIFPDTPLICYFEWFYNPVGTDADFDGKILTEFERTKLRCKNTHILMDLASCDGGISPTQWQKKQFPEKFHSQIKVLHDGIDTDICAPKLDAEFFIKEKKIKLSAKDEVVTYVARGMEPYRGFPQFMLAVEKILKKRPNTHVVIAGEDKVFYGAQPPEGLTFKSAILDRLNFDMERLHFVGKLPYDEYLKLLQISSVHAYLTYPFVLSWSILEAMSCGCCVVASDTSPVTEVIKDNYNGLLTDFYNINQIVEKIEYAMDNKEEMLEIRKNARKTIIENYSLKKLLPKHIEYIKSFIK